MPEIDQFSQQLLEEAKRYLEKASGEKSSEAKVAFLHAALLLGFSSLEGSINSVAEDLSSRPGLALVELSLVCEKDVAFDDGEFSLGNRLKMQRLEDRVAFLFRKFSGRALDDTDKWWGQLKGSLKLRNKLVHPKEVPEITVTIVTSALESVIDCIDAIYRAVYKRGLPAKVRGLSSILTF